MMPVTMTAVNVTIALMNLLRMPEKQLQQGTRLCSSSCHTALQKQAVPQA